MPPGDGDVFTVTRAGDTSLVPAALYAGPVDHLDYQYVASESDDEVIIGTARNDFINARGGFDAIDGGTGDDVLDGGTGSNFLAGGAGRDVFFLDGRSGEVTWSTVVDWEAGEQLSVWGWQDGVSTATWADQAGAEGYQGVTLHADLDGDGVIDTSVTWAGLSRGGLPEPTVVASEGLLWFIG